MAKYIDRHGNILQIRQKAGRRSLEMLGYRLWESDDDAPAVDPDATPEPPAPGGPLVTDVTERGDLGGVVVESEKPPLGVNIEPDAEPSGEPAPWIAEAEQAAAELDGVPAPAEAKGDVDPVSADQGVSDVELAAAADIDAPTLPTPDPEPAPEPVAKPATKTRTRRKPAASD